MPMAMLETEISEAREPESVEALFASYERPLLRYAYKLVHSREICQEIVQETFMKLHTRFDEVKKPCPWLYRTVHDLAMNHDRVGKNAVESRKVQDGANRNIPMDTGLPSDEQSTQSDVFHRTLLCLDWLKKQERELVEMKLVEGLSYHEMSRRTGLSVGIVGSTLHHALKRLASALEHTGTSL